MKYFEQEDFILDRNYLMYYWPNKYKASKIIKLYRNTVHPLHYSSSAYPVQSARRGLAKEQTQPVM